MASGFLDPTVIRSRFAQAMSDMYRREVPQYGALVALVDRINAATLDADPALAAALDASGERARIAGERHGAIRVGTAAELGLIARGFAVMGMAPVGYYDLAPAGVPVHSTAFRPVEAAALRRNPFRLFTSLLRLDLIADPGLRAEAAAILARRTIMTPAAVSLIGQAEQEGGLSEGDADRFVQELLETFRWHGEATVDGATYQRLLGAHRLIADIVCFRGPHINHLTPRTLDIDAVQAAMPGAGMAAKDVIEGPPERRCPVLLRQTSFKALDEAVVFPGDGGRVAGGHSARFGEVEQRGVALTPKGRALYDALLVDGPSHAGGLPDDWAALRRHDLAFFRYRLTAAGQVARRDGRAVSADIETAIADGHVQADPIVYEDFLPVSAAGIFRSNLGDEAASAYRSGGNRAGLEAAIGRPILDEFALYAEEQAASLRRLAADGG